MVNSEKVELVKQICNQALEVSNEDDSNPDSYNAGWVAGEASIARKILNQIVNV